MYTVITDAQLTRVDGNFMIATEDSPFVNMDAWYRFKFNSGDVQNTAIKLKGKKVRISKYGWRLTMVSQYENIVGNQMSMTLERQEQGDTEKYPPNRVTLVEMLEHPMPETEPPQ